MIIDIKRIRLPLVHRAGSRYIKWSWSLLKKGSISVVRHGLGSLFRSTFEKYTLICIIDWSGSCIPVEYGSKYFDSNFLVIFNFFANLWRVQQFLLHTFARFVLQKSAKTVVSISKVKHMRSLYKISKKSCHSNMATCYIKRTKDFLDIWK